MREAPSSLTREEGEREGREGGKGGSEEGEREGGREGVVSVSMQSAVGAFHCWHL